MLDLFNEVAGARDASRTPNAVIVCEQNLESLGTRRAAKLIHVQKFDERIMDGGITGAPKRQPWVDIYGRENKWEMIRRISMIKLLAIVGIRNHRSDQDKSRPLHRFVPCHLAFCFWLLLSISRIAAGRALVPTFDLT